MSFNNFLKFGRNGNEKSADVKAALQKFVIQNLWTNFYEKYLNFCLPYFLCASDGSSFMELFLWQDIFYLHLSVTKWIIFHFKSDTEKMCFSFEREREREVYNWRLSDQMDPLDSMWNESWNKYFRSKNLTFSLKNVQYTSLLPAMLVNYDSYDFYAMTMNYPLLMMLIHFICFSLFLSFFPPARSPFYRLFIKFYETQEYASQFYLISAHIVLSVCFM